MTEPDPVGSTQTPPPPTAAVCDVAQSPGKDTPAARYERHVATFARPFARAVADVLVESAPRTVLDHGAGTGLVARLVHRRCPSSHVVALDPSVELLRGLDGEGHCTVLHGVAGDLDREAPGLRVDAVGSSLSLMFCNDPVGDLSILRTHTVPAGSVAIAVLGGANEVEPFWRYWSATQRIVPSAWQPDDYPHHRFADPEVFRRTVAAAGWRETAMAPVVGRRRMTAANAWEWLHGALPVGMGTTYGQIPADIVDSVRAEFVGEWGAVRTVTSRGWMLRGLNPA